MRTWIGNIAGCWVDSAAADKTSTLSRDSVLVGAQINEAKRILNLRLGGSKVWRFILITSGLSASNVDFWPIANML